MARSLDVILVVDLESTCWEGSPLTAAGLWSLREARNRYGQFHLGNY